jgi:hypothetical protein
MAFETATALSAAGLLIVAGLARGLSFLRGERPWSLVSVGARLAAAAALVVTLVLVVQAVGEWSPFRSQQVALALALAALCSHLVLTWRCGADGASPAVDVIACVLIVWEAWAMRPGGPALTLAQRAVAFHLEWLFFLVGGGGAIVAGSTSLILGLRALWPGTGRSPELSSVAELYGFLRNATALALIALGAGLMVSLWWSWRTLGSVSGGDPREAWLAGAWLLTGASLLAWQLERRAGRWAAGLAGVAAMFTVVGLLSVANSSQALGF